MNVPSVLVVTGTDTGVGKTVVTAALAASLAPGRSVAVLKPVQTGAASAERADTDEVRRLAGVATVQEGVRLGAPLAPVAAARLEEARLPPISAHVTTVMDLARTHDVVLVEGSGGLLVDLDADGNGLCELAAETPAPVSFVVVTRAALGTLNHSRLTVEALRVRNLRVTGLVVGAVPAEPGLAEQANLVDLTEVTRTPLVGQVPEGAGALDPAAFRSRARDWLSRELCP
jgi:dethiobiotin synthetase